MKVLVFAHKMDIGGTQRNAIDLSVALREQFGHDIVIFATPGPMVEVIREKGLRFIAAPEPKSAPSLEMMRALRDVIRRESPDLVHAWDWWQCVDAYYGSHLFLGIPLIVSDMMSDGVTRFLPKSLVTTFGTPEFVDLAKAAGRSHVELLLPPVDAHLNAPGAGEDESFRKQYSLTANEITLVTVSRLAVDLKAESLRRTIAAVHSLAATMPLRLLLVGDGDAKGELQMLADKVNLDLGRIVVTLTGEMVDPRAAYAAADIVVGMGGSALRGMAFEKPVIVVGAKGFSEILSEKTAKDFYYRGIYGIGDEDEDNKNLISNIRSLAVSQEFRLALGVYSRQFMMEHFSLEKVCSNLERFYTLAILKERKFVVTVVDGLRTAVLFGLRNRIPKIVRIYLKNRQSKQITLMNGQIEGRSDLNIQ